MTHAIHNSPLSSIPERSCVDAKPSAPVLYFMTGAEDNLSVERGSCLVVTVASPEELLRTSEYLSYRALGVIS